MIVLHTPGPWEVQKSGENHIYIQELGNKKVRMPIADIHPQRLDADANALLIAAAPEMREVLIECLNAEARRRKLLRDGSPASTYTKNRIQRIQAVLAKTCFSTSDLDPQERS